jgi:SAM-dependent methyltransferase
MPDQKTFEAYITEANQALFSGWDFQFLANRFFVSEPPWDFRDIVLAHLPKCSALLDMGTGGGEFLSSLPNLPPLTAATEGWLPNLEIARTRLEPLGIAVHFFEQDDALPFMDEQFDLIINRHESFSADETMRILKPGGFFISQQVGGLDNFELNQFLAPDIPFPFEHWQIETAVHQLQKSGFDILDKMTAKITYTFRDIGAIVYYLKICEWQIPGFSVENYMNPLLNLHQLIEQKGAFHTSGERFLIQAQKKIVV